MFYVLVLNYISIVNLIQLRRRQQRLIRRRPQGRPRQSQLLLQFHSPVQDVCVLTASRFLSFYGTWCHAGIGMGGMASAFCLEMRYVM